MSDQNKPNDYVVVRDGQRVSGLVSEAEAQAKAAALRKSINEQAGATAQESNVQVKRNLFG